MKDANFKPRGYKILSVLLTIAVILWSVSIPLGVLLPLGVTKAQTGFFVTYVQRDSTNDKIVHVEFSAQVDPTTAEGSANLSKYTLNKSGGATVNPTAASVQNGNLIVDLTFADTVAVGSTGDILNVVGVQNQTGSPQSDTNIFIFSEIDDQGGWFGPSVVINEVVTDPQQDWSTNNFNGTAGSGTVNADDQYVELRINQQGLNLSGWTMKVQESTWSGPFDQGSLGASGLFTISQYNSSTGGSFNSTKAGDYLVLGNLNGTNLSSMSNNVYIELKDATNVWIDKVTVGTYEDGMIDDNAPGGDATNTSDEALGLDNFGTKMGWDREDYFKQAATPGAVNTYNPSLELFGVFAQDATHVGLDFNEPPKASTIFTSNFSIVDTATSTALAVQKAVVESAGSGKFINLETATMSNVEYKLTVSQSVTDIDGNPITDTERVRYFTGYAADSTAPRPTSVYPLDATMLEVYFDETNGLDASGVSYTLAETATPSNTISVSSTDAMWDMLNLTLASAQTAGTDYTLTITGLKDSAATPNTLTATSFGGTTDNQLNFVGFNPAGWDSGEAPTVLYTYPFDMEANVPTNSTLVQIYFSKAMDASTLTTTNISVKKVDVATGSTTGNNLATAVSYVAGTNPKADVTISGLSANSKYRIEVSTAVKDAVGTALLYNYDSEFKTSSGADTQGPTVYGTNLDTYRDTSTGAITSVPTGTDIITLFFDSDVDPSTIETTNTTASGSPVTLTTTSSGTTKQVSAGVTYFGYSLSAEVKIKELLKANTKYTLTVSSADVKDSAGNAMTADYKLIFTTAGADTTKPKIDFADSDGWFVWVQFNESLNEASAKTKANWTLYSDANATPTTLIDITNATINYSAWENGVEITGLSLTTNNYFKVVASSSVTDTSGNAVDSSYNSYTGQVANWDKWDEGPHIWGTSPYGWQTNVALNTVVAISFDTALNSDTVTTTNITLTKVGGSAVTGTVQYLKTPKIAVFTPGANLDANSEYEIKVENIKDSNGVAMPFPFYQSFYTGGGTDVVAPQVSGNIMYNNDMTLNNGATEIPSAISRVIINFNEGMNPASLNTGTIILATDVADTATYTPGDIKYDPFAYMAEFMPNQALTTNTAYTLRIVGGSSGVKDMAGNVLAANSDLTFTTTATADILLPVVTWADADPFGFFVMFSEPVRESTATNIKNYKLETATTTGSYYAVSLEGKSVWYDTWSNGARVDGLNLTAGNKFKVTVSNLKDLAGNNISISLDSTLAARSLSGAGVLNNNQWEGNVFDWTYKDDKPFVTYSWPYPGQWDAPPNLGAVEVGFSEAMNPTTIDSSTFKLQKKNTDGTFTDLTATSYTYNTETETAFFNLDPAAGTENVNKLAASTEYRVLITDGITDEGGYNLESFDPWNPTSTTSYEVFFTTSGSVDNSAPTVIGTSLEQYQNYNTGAIENVPVGGAVIEVMFNKSMNESTVRDMDAADDSQGIYLETGGTKVAGFVEYDFFANRAMFVATSNLTKNTTYTLTVTADVKDSLGNALAAWTQNFTTANQDDTVGPIVGYAECENFECRIFFNEPLVKTEAEKLRNYKLHSPIGTPVSLENKKIKYETMGNMVIIKDLNLGADNSFKVTVSGVTDLAGQFIQTGADTQAQDFPGDPNVPRDVDGTANNFNEMEGYIWGKWVETDKSTFTEGQMIFDHFAEFMVMPFNPMAGKTSNYAVDFPLSVALTSGSKIKIQFPEGFDVSSAGIMEAFDAASTYTMDQMKMDLSPVNADINGWGAGTVTISGVSLNTASRTMELTTSGNLAAGDFVTIDLKGIKNSSTPMEPGNFMKSGGSAQKGTEGYRATLTTTDSSGKLKEGPITSGPFFIMGKGTGQITVNVTATGVDNNETMTVRLDSFSGMMDSGTITFTSGTGSYIFKELPSGDYHVFTDPVIILAKSGTDTEFFGPNFPEPIWVNNDTQTKSITLKDSTSSTYSDDYGNEQTMRTLTVNITGGPASENVMIHVGSPWFWADKKVTLDANGASSGITFKIPDDFYMVGIDPAMMMDMKFSMGPPPPPSFVPPPPLNVDVNGAKEGPEVGVDEVTFALSNYSASQYLEVTVKDKDGGGVPDAEVHAYDPMSFFGTPPQRTDGTGKATLKLPAGDYIVDAWIPGLPPMPPKSVIVTSSHTQSSPATLALSMEMKSIKITGKVKDGNTPMPKTPVFAQELDSQNNPTGVYIDVLTDASGDYKFFVDSGTNWEIGSFMPGKGETDLTTLTNVTQNLSNKDLIAKTDLVTIQGVVKIGGAPLQKAAIYAEGIGSTTTHNATHTDTTGAFKVKVPAGTYKIGNYSPQVGDRVLAASVDVSDGLDENLGNLNIDPDNAAVKVTVEFKDENGALYTPEEAFVELTDASGNKNYLDFKNLSSGEVKVPEGEYTVKAFVDEAGKMTATTLNTTTSTDDKVNFTVPTPVSVKGTITNEDTASALEKAVVTVYDPLTGFFKESQTDSSGNYDIKVPQNASYLVSVEKKDYFNEADTFVSVTTSDSESNNFAMDDLEGSEAAGGVFISGSLTKGSTSANNDAYVIMESTDGDKITAAVGPDGTYSAEVQPNKNYFVEGFADGYETAVANIQEVSVGTSSQSANVTLAAKSDYSIKKSKTETVVPANGGVVKYEDLKLVIPPNTLGTSSDPYSVIIKETTQLAPSKGAMPLDNTSYDVEVKNNKGESVNILNDAIFMEFDLSGQTSVDEKTNCGYQDPKIDKWIVLPTAVDTTNKKLTCATDHLTGVAPTSPASSTSSPSAPTSPQASVGTSSITVSWTAPTTKTNGSPLTDLAGYEVYRSTSEGGTYSNISGDSTQNNGWYPSRLVTTTSYEDTSATADVTYYYKIAAFNDSAQNSTASSFVSAKITTPSGSAPAGSPPSETVTAEEPSEEVEEKETPVEEVTPGEVVITPAEEPTLPVRAVEVDLEGEKTALGDFVALKRALPKTSEDWQSIHFVTYGTTDYSKKLSSRERTGVLKEYQEAFGRLPQTSVQWGDVEKIMQGNKPSEQSLTKEKEAIGLFGGIYGKLPATSEDWTFVHWVAYKIRPAARNLSQERVAIGEFRSLGYFKGALPSSSQDWAAVRALAYVK